MGLREYLQEVESQAQDQVLKIDREVDPLYEISAVVTLLERRRQTPILWFTNVKGSKFPVVVNVAASKARLASAIGATQKELVQGYLNRSDNPLPPVEVTTGPVKDVVLLGEEADVLKFPQITHHGNDGGPFITCGMALARDPETGKYNASFNRLMMKGPHKLNVCMTPGRHLREIYMRYKESGRPMPLAICIGLPLAYSPGAVYAGPHDADEIEIMGGLQGSPVPMVRCETIDLSVPAEAEIVIEGEVPLDAMETEGPLAEFTGYSSGIREREILEVKAITHRRNAIFQDITPGHREMFLLTASAQEACLYRILKGLVPSLQAIHIPAPFILFISIKQRAAGQAKQAVFAGLASEFYMKTVVVVDEDIDIHNDQEVWWAVGTRVQPDRDVFTVPHVLGSELDPSCLTDGVTAKMGIDATAKPSLHQFAKRNNIPQEVLDRVEKSGLV
ncbi:MAG: UbiD family decarboxylase [Syntrophales bacterium LBB04]|nr:UbiD family decarboxylase [Syntrophales bacterium LBB04]